MPETQNNPNALLDIQKLWAKYEDIAMHFNDLLMRLRSRSLAGIAALSTIVGILARGDIASISVSWFVAAGIFIAMALFWIAIWCLDFLYYNRLLLGAVCALKQIEDATAQRTYNAIAINMSTLIEAEFRRPLRIGDVQHLRGVLIFYLLVLFALIAGAFFCYYMHEQGTPYSAPIPTRFFSDVVSSLVSA